MATKVRFVSNQFEIQVSDNGNWSSWEKFYPIGWYSPSNLLPSCSEPPDVCFSDTDQTRQAMTDLADAGCNTIIEYFNGVIGRYSGLIEPCYDINNTNSYSAANYVRALNGYLDDAHSHGLKVIVHLPYTQVWNDNLLIDDTYLNCVINAVKDHDALLGWYQADEPENLDVSPAATYERLRERYELIKSLDSNHPVFVVYISEVCFRGLYTTLNGDISTLPSYCSEGGLLDTGDYEGRIYDVLMLDYYPVVADRLENIKVCDPDLCFDDIDFDDCHTTPCCEPPDYDFMAPEQLRDIRHNAAMLRNIYEHEDSSNNNGALMFVSQGFGYKDLRGDVHGEGMFDQIEITRINPTTEYILFAALTAACHMQVSSLYGHNMAGLLYWSHRYADSELRNRINSFISYASDPHVELLQALNSTESISGITVTFNNPSVSYGWAFYHFVRVYNGNIYIFVLPDKENNSDCKKTVVFDSLQVSGVSSHQYCHELVPEGGDQWYRIWVSLDDVGSNTVEFMEVESRTYKTYQARVFRITT